MHGSTLSVLSEETILVIRLREPALELCRLESSEHWGRSRRQHVALEGEEGQVCRSRNE